MMKVQDHICFVGLGSNIDPETNLRSATALLRYKYTSVCFSSVYRTAPQEVTDQPDFLNAVARIETDQTPEEVRGILKEIEQKLGKAPPYRFGPRTIDLDLLLYNNLVLPSMKEWQNYTLQIKNYKLIIPHPKMHERRFVLQPLCEVINPESVHPTLALSWNNLLRKVNDQDCIRTKIVL